MNGAERIKEERNREERVAGIVRRIENIRPGDEEIKAIAAKLVAARSPLPACREPYTGEHRNHHADFVSARLKLITAMRQEATKQGVDEAYRLYLWSRP